MTHNKDIILVLNTSSQKEGKRETKINEENPHTV